ncbi:DUF1947 domain-containing protein [Candidatus Woesearchaeota archaeon]|nr:DUF1947 domain-containing protein [Candidatus Woesearchaeota archaeon]
MKKKTLSKREIKDINEKISKYGFQFGKKEFAELAEDEKHKFLKADKALFFYVDGEWVPSLKALLSGRVGLKKVTVDMGAVKFVVNGADIMRPGIVEIEDNISENEIVEIADVDNKKPLAVGRALFGSPEMKEKKEGKAVKNLHFIGDDIWQA